VLDRSDDDLVLLAREELERWLGPLGETRISRVNRYEQASPQPMLGHLARMRKIHERIEEHAGLHLAGNGYDGSGIPDCIKQSDRAARGALARRPEMSRALAAPIPPHS
jgi:oxygen-dependent protoporphyrinogen oxidase